MPSSSIRHGLPKDVSLRSGLSFSLSGDEAMPLGYHTGRSGWLLYGRGLNKRRLMNQQRELGAVLVIVASWVAKDYQMIRLTGSLTLRMTRLAYETGLDVALSGRIPHLHTPDLLVMDMNSMVIQVECTDEIAKLVNTDGLVSEVTGRAMCGELDFTVSLYRHVATLKDADATTLLQVYDTPPLMSGLAQLVFELGTLGQKVVIASDGSTSFIGYLRDKLHPDVASVNELEIRSGKPTGNVLNDIVDAKHKVNTSCKPAEKYETPTAQIVAIGDGANDLLMIKAASLGIAHHAKSKASEQAGVTIRHVDPMGVFRILSGSMNQK